MYRKLGIRITVAVFTVILLFNGAAFADNLRLRIQDLDTGQGVVLSDSDDDGVINYEGGIGNFVYNLTAGISSGGQLSLQANDFHLSWGSGTLRITLEADYHTAPGTVPMSYAVAGEIWGDATSKVTVENWISNSGSPSLGPDTFPAGPLGGIGSNSGDHVSTASDVDNSVRNGLWTFFDNSGSIEFNAAGNYSMFTQVTVYFAPGMETQWTTFSSTQSVANPEPTSLLLLGSGLAGIGLLGRRRKAK